MNNRRAVSSRRHVFTEKEKAEIDAACETAADPALRRLEVLRQYAEGKTYDQIVQATGYSKSAVWRILRRYLADGLEPIRSEPVTGKRKYTANRYELTPEQIAELEEGYKNAVKPHVARRFKALLLRCEGKTMREAADATGLSVSRIVHFTHNYRKYGIAALTGKTRASAASRIFTSEQKNELAEARKAATDKRIIKRLDAVCLCAEGKTTAEISAEVGLHHETVKNLIRKYWKHGIEGIIRNGYGKQGHSNRRYLSYEEESAALEECRLAAKDGRIITTEEIKAALESRIGHSVTCAYVKLVARNHDWVPGWVPPSEEQIIA